MVRHWEQFLPEAKAIAWNQLLLFIICGHFFKIFLCFHFHIGDRDFCLHNLVFLSFLCHFGMNIQSCWFSLLETSAVFSKLKMVSFLREEPCFSSLNNLLLIGWYLCVQSLLLMNIHYISVIFCFQKAVNTLPASHYTLCIVQISLLILENQHSCQI